MTAQGVRDLNHRGPKEKLATTGDPAIAPADVIDGAPLVITSSAPANDQVACAPTVDNG